MKQVKERGRGFPHQLISTYCDKSWGLGGGWDGEGGTVEPHLSEPHGRHTIRPDNRGVQIDEGNRNSRSMGYRVGDN